MCVRVCACACVCVGGCSYGFFWLVVMSLIIGTLLGYLYLGLISVPTGLWKATPVRVVLQRAPAAAAPGRACVRAARVSARARARCVWKTHSSVRLQPCTSFFTRLRRKRRRYPTL